MNSLEKVSRKKYLTVFVSMNVRKSISMYPIIFRSLQALIIFKHSEFKTRGSTEVCGNEIPQHEYSDSACK